MAITPPPGYVLDNQPSNSPPPGYVLDSNLTESNTGGLAEKASGIVQSMVNPFVNPSINPVQTQMNQGKKVLQAGQAADKRYPAENLLPGLGASLAVGGMSTVFPFADTVAAGLGGAGGSYLKNIISAARGNPTPQNIGEMTKDAGIEGGKMAGAELGGAMAMKVGGGLLEAIGGLGKKGLGAFKDYLMNETKPVDKAVTDAIREKLSTLPVSDTSGVADTAKNILETKGFNVSTPNELPNSMSQIQIKNLQDAGLSTSDIQKLSQAGVSNTESGVQQIASQLKPKLSSDLKSLDPNDYKMLNNVYQDLQDPAKVADLTYGDLANLKHEVGQYGNFGAKDQARTPLDNMYGKIYDKVNQLMSNTADKGGMLNEHNYAMREGRKYFQNKLLQNLQDTSMDNGINPKAGPQIDWAELSSKLDNFTPGQVKRVFGDNSDKFQALKELAATYAQTATKSIGMSPRINPLSQTASVPIRLPFLNHPIRTANTADYVQAILSRNLPGNTAAEVAYPGLNAIQKTKEVGKVISPPLSTYIRNKRKQ